ncbi:predicted protein [Nematostella vectensis]|uniref:G-protein coupled receptors family 1 profile domain-containing protein n=1 Tax=Nematostella vectensis TaxID=45351 RepID=A7SL32_NEMVE|nr:melanocortin receptor 3 [Nematostella vectensis]EDO35572.1 predicted protein [Nematostella vectensis]|eukprot:XP_001627672.1 predicted protein [Nematostella vectensis]
MQSTFNGTHDNTCFFLRLDTRAVHEVYASFIVAIAMNIIGSIPTVLLNALVVLAIWRSAHLHSPSQMLLCNLAVTDLGVGMVSQPFYVAYKFSEINHDFVSYCWTGVTALVSSYIFAGGSFMTLTAISLDRYLALHMGLRYKTIVTSSRVTRLILLLWVLSILLGLSQLVLSTKAFIRLIAAVMTICLVTSISAYIMAFKELKRHQARVTTSHRDPTSLDPMDLNKYRKSLITMVQILVLILLSYVPYLCVSVAIAITGLNSQTRAARNITSPILFLNSGVNPVFYIWKIREIGNACRIVIRNALHLNVVLPETHSEEESNMSRFDSRMIKSRALPVVS